MSPVTPVAGDDSAGFDDLERTFVRRIVPDFDWLPFDEPSPRHDLPVPLSEARVGLVTTAGAHQPDQPGMSPDGDVRLIPLDAAGRMCLSHIGYDTIRAARDPDVVVPIGALRRLADAGFIGSLSPTVVSTMGFIPNGADVFDRTAPATVEALRRNDVDLALLVSA